jgi:hypothetical protein
LIVYSKLLDIAKAGCKVMRSNDNHFWNEIGFYERYNQKNLKDAEKTEMVNQLVARINCELGAEVIRKRDIVDPKAVRRLLTTMLYADEKSFNVSHYFCVCHCFCVCVIAFVCVCVIAFVCVSLLLCVCVCHCFCVCVIAFVCVSLLLCVCVTAYLCDSLSDNFSDYLCVCVCV